MKTQVTIIGAGPTGLMLALWLVRLGVDVRIFDKKPGPTLETRALGVQSRTMETYHQLGIVDDAMKEGCEAKAANLWLKGMHIGRFNLEDMGKGLSPYPYMFILGQDKNESLLIDHLKKSGVSVHWNTTLESFFQNEDSVFATLCDSSGHKIQVQSSYLCGCDGAGSLTRRLMGMEFPGGTYEHLFFVADVIASGKIREGELNLCFDDTRFHAFFPMPGKDHFRIVGMVPHPPVREKELTFDNMRSEVESRFAAVVSRVDWFSTYRVHHRVVPQFQKDRIFLLGDAAHIHSPVGGQGMNTGLMDASNLAWKIAHVIQKREIPAILDSYTLERRPFAKTLVNTTDRLFSFGTSTSLIAQLGRNIFIPLVLKLINHAHILQNFLFRTISQTRIHYRKSPLSQGRKGRIAAGDRLPWVLFSNGESNYDALKSLKPQIHYYGNPDSALKSRVEKNQTSEIYHFDDCVESRNSGFLPEVVYLVRPDGYLRFVGNITQFYSYLESLEIP